MALLLDQIQWGEPVLPLVPDRAWDARLKSVLGTKPDFLRRISPSQWLREVTLEWSCYRPIVVPPRVYDIVFLVASQENSCRYCYGAARAQMRLLGYSEAVISQIEREVQLAELDARDRVLIRFCRNLARSNPRPGRADQDFLIEAGYSPLAVAEIAFMIAAKCFENRLATLLACPAEHALERIGGSFMGRLLRPLFVHMLRRDLSAKLRIQPKPPSVFGPVVRTLDGLPASTLLTRALTAAFDSPVLPRKTKHLMFAVVARALECRNCEIEVVRQLGQEGISGAEVDASLSTLTFPGLDSQGQALLSWTRDTVHFEPLSMQKSTRQLADQIGDAAMLEAVGVAALANATVRLAMLLV